MASLLAFCRVTSEMFTLLSIIVSANVRVSSPLLRSRTEDCSLGPVLSMITLSASLGVPIAAALLPLKSKAVLLCMVM